MMPSLSYALLTEADLDFMVDLKANAALWPYEDNLPTDKDEVRRLVTGRMAGGWYRQYVLRLAEEAAPIGEFHVHWYVRERKSVEIGYCLLPAYRGRGLGLAAGRAALSLAFEEWDAHKVVAMCNARNHASSHVLQKLGMTLEGTFREELPIDGRWDDQLFYCMLETEYRAGLSPR